MRTLTVFMILLSAAVFAADVDFSGEWVLNQDKSEFPEMSESRGPGDGRRFAAANLTITQKENELTVSRAMIGRSGEERVRETVYDLSGKTTKQEGRRGPTMHTAKVEDNVLHIKSVRAMEREGTAFEIVTTQKWSVVDDGKGLLIESSMESQRGTMESKSYYEKK